MGFLKYILIFFCLFFIPWFFVEAKALNSVEEFYVNDKFKDLKGFEKIKAELKFIGDNAYFYVESDYLNSLNEIEKSSLLASVRLLSKEYDERIFPVLTSRLGGMNDYGIDNDRKIYILFLKLKKDIGGYVSTADIFLKDRVEGGVSNEKEIIYLNLDFLDKKLERLLAHEFQHLLSIKSKDINNKILDDIWLNELRSEYVLNFLNYNKPYNGSFLENRVSFFNKHPSDSLLEWQNDEKDYASVALFAEYLADTYSDLLFKESLKNDKFGVDSLNEAFKVLGFDVDFSEAFKKWQLANYLNDIESFGVGYGYKNKDINVKIKPTKSHILNSDRSSFEYVVKDWQSNWLEYVVDSDYLRVVFKSNTGDNFSLSYILKRKGGGVFFSEIDLSEGYSDFVFDGVSDGIDKLILIPVSRSKVLGFSGDEKKKRFNITLIKNKNIESINFKDGIIYDNIKDGDLVRPAWSYNVYVYKRGYIKHIKNLEILKLYNKEVKVLSRDEFKQLKESYLFRIEGDSKVYEMNKNGDFKWLDMTADDFVKSGRSFDSVFEIKKEEFNLYKIK